MGKTIHVTDAEFEKVVLKASKPVLVDFWAPWCVPCRMVAPILDKIASEKGDEMIIAKVNTDEHSKWAIKYGVQGIPTMLFIANGEVIKTQVGALPEPMLRQALDKFLSSVAITI